MLNEQVCVKGETAHFVIYGVKIDIAFIAHGQWDDVDGWTRSRATESETKDPFKTKFLLVWA